MLLTEWQSNELRQRHLLRLTISGNPDRNRLLRDVELQRGAEPVPERQSAPLHQFEFVSSPPAVCAEPVGTAPDGVGHEPEKLLDKEFIRDVLRAIALEPDASIVTHLTARQRSVL
jgi:hypothetical protein